MTLWSQSEQGADSCKTHSLCPNSVQARERGLRPFAGFFFMGLQKLELRTLAIPCKNVGPIRMWRTDKGRQRFRLIWLGRDFSYCQGKVENERQSESQGKKMTDQELLDSFFNHVFPFLWIFRTRTKNVWVSTNCLSDVLHYFFFPNGEASDHQEPAIMK